MVYIVVKLWYPSHKTKEVEARYMEMLQKYPPDNSIAERVVLLAGRAAKEGLEVMTISLVKEGKFDEAPIRAGSGCGMFDDIEGLEYWVTFQEAQAMGNE